MVTFIKKGSSLRQQSIPSSQQVYRGLPWPVRRSAAEYVLLPVMVVLLFCSVSCSRRKQPPEPAHIFGVEAMTSALSAAGHQEVLSGWMTKGYRDETVFHIGAKAGFAPLPDSQMKKVKAFMEDVRGTAAAGRLITPENFLAVAFRLGLIKKVVWVIPFNYLGYIDAEERIKVFLREEASYLPSKDINSLKFRDGCVSGSLIGIETAICSPSTVSPLNEPSLLVLDADFFPRLAEWKPFEGPGSIHYLFAQMAPRQLTVRSAYVVQSPELKAVEGYLSEQAVEAIRDPSIIRKSGPPKLWLVRERAVQMMNSGAWQEALSFLDERIREMGKDPYLMLMRETANAFISGEKALDALSSLCLERPAFCRGIVDAGVALRGKGDIRRAEEFFRKAVSVSQGSGVAAIEYSYMLIEEGRYEDAIRVLEGVSDESYPVLPGLLIGDCYYALKREDDAVKNYEKALSAYRDSGKYLLDRRERESLTRLQKIYEKRNDFSGTSVLTEVLHK